MSDGDSGTGDPNVWEENPYLPDLHVGPRISHYYGDYVRQLFLINSVILLIGSPFLSTSQPLVLPFEIGGAILVAIVGALVSPARQLSLMATGLVSIIGVATFELLALSAFFSGSMFVFAAREVVAIIFLFALYFSLKTLRHMMLGTVGKKGGKNQIVERETI